jgi:hypothetical protein
MNDQSTSLVHSARNVFLPVFVLLATLASSGCGDSDPIPTSDGGGDSGPRTDAGGCPLTGVLCDPACPASGVLPGGAPCTRGDFNALTCECEPPTVLDGGALGDGGGCPLTGVACAPDCPTSGMLPGGAPCTRGNFDMASCTCDPIPEVDAGMCPLTGIACTPDCPASGMLPSGAPCTRGNFDMASCACVPVSG